MAVRYSGDSEIRVWWDRTRREYHGSVKNDYLRFPGHARASGWGDPTSSEAYDRAAVELMNQADRWVRAERMRQRFQFDRDGRGRLVAKRVFESPCPTTPKTSHRGDRT